MKLLVQWATKHPQGWIELDSSEWAALAKKPEPVGGEEIDDAPGWLNDVCVQGMCAGSVDHVAIEQVGDAVRMTLWRDDPEDYTPGQYSARVITFHPLRPDPELGGAVNTHIDSVIYAGPERYEELQTHDIADSEVRPWSEFVPPPEAITRHGIWLSEGNAAKHLRIRRRISWREWGEDGNVPCQRDLGRWKRAKGTITYYLRGTQGGGTGDDVYAGGPFNPAIGQNFWLTKNSTTVNDVTRDILQKTDSEISFAWTSEDSEPNDDDWPTGDYNAQIDINGLEDGDVRAETQIVQIQSTGAIRETFGTSAEYSTTGLKLFTVASHNPGSGATTDRYQIRVLGTNVYTHQPRLLTLGTRTTDSYADGPWTASVQDSSDRDARTAGKVSDTASDRDARTYGGITASSDRDARTEGQVTTSSDRDARTAGKISDTSSDRDARTYGGVTASSDRDARTEGTSAGTQTSSDRDARTYGGTATSSDRDAATKGAGVVYVDHTVDKSTVAREDPTFEHITPAGADCYLLVAFFYVNAAANAPTSVTHDGNEMDVITAGWVSNCWCRLYGLELGTLGTPDTSNISILTPATNVADYIVAANYTDVRQASSIGAMDADSSSGLATKQNDITTHTANSLLVQCAFDTDDAASPYTPNSSQVERLDDNTGGGSATDDLGCAIYDIAAATVQEYNLSVTSSTGGIGLLAIELKQALSGIRDDDTRDARTYGGVTAASDRDARTEGTSGGTQTSSDRDARATGQVSDEASDRDARTAGQVADTASDRDARTAGQVADTFSDRDARTAGKVSDSATDRDSRTHGKVSDTASDRDARTYGGTTVSSDRDARTEGTVTGTQTSSDRDARTAGKVTGESSDRDARTQGGITTASDRDARVAGKVSDESSDRDAATKGWGETPPGIVTYYQRGAWGGGGAGDDADHSLCTPSAFNYILSLSSAAQATVKDTVPGTTTDRDSFSFTTESSNPPVPWPTGDYRAQVDVTQIGADIVFRIQLLRTKLADCAVLETIGTSGNLSGTGLHLFTVVGADPGDTGRFQVRIICDNTDASPQDIKLNVRGTNSFADGPWGYLESDTRDARTRGLTIDDSDSRSARTVGANIASTDRDARTHGKATGQYNARTARTAGQISGYATDRDARTEGQTFTASDRDARTAGKTDASSDRDARTEGVGLDASGTRDARTAGKVTGESDTRDARTAGGTTTSTDRDARTEGQTTVSSDRDARTAGIATTSSERAARTEGGGWIVSTTRAARLEGVSVPSVSPPGMAHDKHPDPSEAGGRVPQPKFYVVYSEDTTERVRTLFPQSRRKRRR